jgi:hypothetical protein
MCIGLLTPVAISVEYLLSVGTAVIVYVVGIVVVWIKWIVNRSDDEIIDVIVGMEEDVTFCDWLIVSTVVGVVNSWIISFNLFSFAKSTADLPD